MQLRLAKEKGLRSQKDFPKDSPILVITDGLCESDLQIARDHALLVSSGHEAAVLNAQAGVQHVIDMLDALMPMQC